MVNVQIFGVKNSPATRAAERFFKERRATIQIVDLKQKPMAAGEIRGFIDRFGLQRLGLERNILEFRVLLYQLDRLALDNLVTQNVHQAALLELCPDAADTFAARWRSIGLNGTMGSIRPG